MFKKIALTGGPCSLKTTVLAYLSERLWDFVHRPLIMPEVATQLITGGVQDIDKIASVDPKLYLEIERAMFLIMGDYEKRLEALARSFSDNEKVVILCDRGRMDVKAYVGRAGFADILQQANIGSEHEVCTDYDAVIHLVTAAKGAEAFYTLKNNKARRETSEQAREADDRTLDAWKDHPHLVVIDNYHSTSAEHKIRRVLQAVLNVLGIPQPVEYERKFLLLQAPAPNIPQFAGTQISTIEQIYLASADTERRIRNRRFGDFNLYYETHKHSIDGGGRVEVERRISADEYARFAQEQKPSTRIIRKTRRCFIYKDRRFELDVFIDPVGLAMLEVELADMSEHVELPPFLEIMCEVTDDSRYTNYALSQKH